MRWIVLILGLVVLGGCADLTADLRTQYEQESALVRTLDDSIGNYRYSDRPW
jgi:hypothetical protein